MKGIYRYYCACDSQGDVAGLFTANIEDVKSSINKGLNFGEILGKHSNVYGILESNDLVLLSSDQDFIANFEKILGTGTISGYNPLEYIDYVSEQEAIAEQEYLAEQEAIEDMEDMEGTE